MATSSIEANDLVTEIIRGKLGGVKDDLAAALDKARQSQDWYLVAAHAQALGGLGLFLEGSAYQPTDVLIAPPPDLKPVKPKNTKYPVVSQDELFSPACNLWELHDKNQRFLTLHDLATVFDCESEIKSPQRRAQAVYVRLKNWADQTGTDLGNVRSQKYKMAKVHDEKVVKEFLDYALQSEGPLTKYRVVKKN